MWPISLVEIICGKGDIHHSSGGASLAEKRRAPPSCSACEPMRLYAIIPSSPHRSPLTVIRGTARPGVLADAMSYTLLRRQQRFLS